MRFLVDASLPRRTSDPIRRHGHEALDVRDVGPSLALDPAVASYARTHGYILLTGDFDFADIRLYPPADFPGIAVIDRPEDSSIAEVLALVGRLLDAPGVVDGLPGRLAIVDSRRIRLRPSLPQTDVGALTESRGAPSTDELATRCRVRRIYHSRHDLIHLLSHNT